MASIVERGSAPVKPDCCGRRRGVSKGCRRARRICAKTLPVTDSNEIGLQLLHAARAPLPLCSEIMIPSRHSAGILPDFQTWVMRACRADWPALRHISIVQTECYLVLQHGHSSAFWLLTSLLGLFEPQQECLSLTLFQLRLDQVQCIGQRDRDSVH